MVSAIPSLKNRKNRVDAFISVFSNNENEIEAAFKDCFKQTDEKIFWSGMSGLSKATELALKKGLVDDLHTNLSDTLSHWVWMQNFCMNTTGGQWIYTGSTPPKDKVYLGFLWKVVSKLYAGSCKKKAYLTSSRPGKIFTDVEEPVLKRNNVEIIKVGDVQEMIEDGEKGYLKSLRGKSKLSNMIGRRADLGQGVEVGFTVDDNKQVLFYKLDSPQLKIDQEVYRVNVKKQKLHPAKKHRIGYYIIDEEKTIEGYVPTDDEFFDKKRRKLREAFYEANEVAYKKGVDQKYRESRDYNLGKAKATEDILTSKSKI